MFNRKPKKPRKPVTKKRFLIEFGLGCTVYCLFAWYMIAYTSKKHFEIYGSSGGDTTEFSLVFFGSIIVYIAMLAAAWLMGKKRFPENWLLKDGTMLAGIWLGGVLTGVLLLAILAKI